MEQQTLFGGGVARPLASRMRPRTLEEFFGQEKLLGEGKILRQLIDSDNVPSMIFWGPPGVGKTTLARIIARRTKAEFVDFSAVTSGVKEIKAVMERAEDVRRFGQKTILFVDEIHRFNKAQQDAFLPYVERGSIVLIGATTENPSFEINSALLSRCKVFVLEALTPAQVTAVLRRALADERGFGGQGVQIDGECLSMIAAFANGDARTALGTLEMAVLNGRRENGRVYVEKQLLEQCVSKKSLLYDKAGEEHYNLISALHKSMRNSDPDAAVYWLARMLEAGEDPLYVARRLIRFASEDIGLADSRALEIAVAAYQACHFLGMPECNLHLTHAVIYLSLAPRSNAVYRAYEAAKQDALHMLDEPVPLVIRNAPTRLMGELGYGEGYVYAHDTADKIAAMECLPESLRGRRYYVPGEAGSEARAKQRLEAVLRWRAAHAQGVGQGGPEDGKAPGAQPQRAGQSGPEDGKAPGAQPQRAGQSGPEGGKTPGTQPQSAGQGGPEGGKTPGAQPQNAGQGGPEDGKAPGAQPQGAGQSGPEDGKAPGAQPRAAQGAPGAEQKAPGQQQKGAEAPKNGGGAHE